MITRYLHYAVTSPVTFCCFMLVIGYDIRAACFYEIALWWFKKKEFRLKLWVIWREVRVNKIFYAKNGRKILFWPLFYTVPFEINLTRIAGILQFIISREQNYRIHSVTTPGFYLKCTRYAPPLWIAKQIYYGANKLCIIKLNFNKVTYASVAFFAQELQA